MPYGKGGCSCAFLQARSRLRFKLELKSFQGQTNTCRYMRHLPLVLSHGRPRTV